MSSIPFIDPSLQVTSTPTLHAENGRSATSKGAAASADPLAIAPKWSAWAPRTVRDAPSWDDDSPGWNAWRTHLSDRVSPRPVDRVLEGREPPLTWAIPRRLNPEVYVSGEGAAKEGPTEITNRLRAFDRLVRARKLTPVDLDFWRQAVEPMVQEPITLSDALERLAIAHALPRMASIVMAADWWPVFDHLIQTAKNALCFGNLSHPWTWQLLAGELSITLAHLFPELQSSGALLQPGVKAIEKGLTTLLDAEGLPAAGKFFLFHPLLASWTRSFALLAEMGPSTLGDDAQTRFVWAARQTLRLTRLTGAPIFELEGSGDLTPWEAAFRLAASAPKDQRVLSGLLRGKPIPADAKAESDMPACALHSDVAQLAVLRPTWNPSEPRLAIDYSRERFMAEIGRGAQLLSGGEWDTRISVDGYEISPDGDWNENCWISNEDVDYLELERDYQGGLKLERHLLLTRRDKILFVADAIMAPTAGEIRHEFSLPLVESADFAPENETQEGYLVTRSPRELKSARPKKLEIEKNGESLRAPSRVARVLPLGLAEWRSATRNGSFGAVDGRLLLSRSSSRSKGLFLPLFFDFDVPRLRRPATWRQLTIAQTRAIQPDDVAVGYRAQIGAQHWLIYRSLAPTANRTVLGHNLVSQFLFAKFATDGKVTPILEIE